MQLPEEIKESLRRNQDQGTDEEEESKGIAPSRKKDDAEGNPGEVNYE